MVAKTAIKIMWNKLFKEIIGFKEKFKYSEFPISVVSKLNIY